MQQIRERDELVVIEAGQTIGERRSLVDEHASEALLSSAGQRGRHR